jgi:anti-anti-sigma factor
MSDQAAQPLAINVSRRGSVTVIALIGSADIDQPAARRGQLREAAAAAQNLVLDLKELTFMCSSWLGVLIQIYKEARARQAQVRLARASPAITQLLHTTRLTEIMPVFDTLEEALAPG